MSSKKFLMIESAVSEEEVKLILESISADDIRQFARIFKTYQKIVSGMNIPSVEDVLDIARQDFADIADEKQGILSKVVGAFGGDRIKKKSVLARLSKTQTQLRNVFLQLEDILTIIDSDIADIRNESFVKGGKIINEDTLRQIAKSMGLKTSAVRKVAREMGWTKGPNVEVPNKLAKAIFDQVDEDPAPKGEEEKTESERMKELKSKVLSSVLSNSAQSQFKSVLASALKQDRGFFAKIFSGGELNKSDLEPQELANDLLALTYGEIVTLADRAKVLKNEDIDKDAVEDYISGKVEKADKENSASDSISSKELRDALTNSKIGKNLKSNEIDAIISVLKGKTIV